MRPVLFEFGPFSIKSYGLMLMIGFLGGIWWATRRAEKCKADPDVILNMGFIALILGVIGARVFYVIHYYQRDFAGKGVFAMIDISRGGLEFYGGFVGGIGGTLLYLLVTGRSIRWYLDIAAPTLMWGLAWGRAGCLLNGCCWGGPTQLPWAITFPYGSLAFRQHWLQYNKITLPKELILMPGSGAYSTVIPYDWLNITEKDLNDPKGAGASCSCAPKPDAGALRTHLDNVGMELPQLRALAAQHRSLSVHPTQIYGILNAFLLAMLLESVFWWRRRHGTVAALAFMIYPVSRFLLEMIRSDNPHDAASLTASQAVSVGIFLCGVTMMVGLRYLRERAPSAAPISPPEQ